MTIRKKLQISNILMLIIPVCVIGIVAMFCVKFLGNHFFDSMEDMFEADNGLYSAQSLVFSYWGDFRDHPEKAAAGLEGELSELGFHLEVRKNGQRTSSNFTDEDEECVETMTGNALHNVENLAFHNQGASLVRQTGVFGDTVWEVTAIRPKEQAGSSFSGSYLRDYLVKFVSIVGIATLSILACTNFLLSQWISRSILKPLKALQEGANRIEEGDLDFAIPTPTRDEIGEVCTDFDQMRKRLKEAAQSKLEYETYRKELLAGISHDLRTPLTSIKGYADGLLEGIADTEEKRLRYYRAIRQRAGDMEVLADNLSSFSHLETERLRMHPKPCRLSDFLKELLDSYAVEAEKKKLLLLNETQDTEVVLLLDEAEMKRVFINIFENSAKYRIAQHSILYLTSKRLKNNELEIAISDDGPGVPEADLERIFNSFYRGDQSRTKPEKGSGLGLAVAKQIVECHGGTIHAEAGRNQGETNAGQGLTIMITLPIYGEKS